MTDGPRFTVARQGDHVGIMDRKLHLFAPFYETGPTSVAERVRKAVIALNIGDDTITGYAWEKEER